MGGSRTVALRAAPGRLSPSGDERGAVLITVVLWLPVLVLIAALVVDLAFAWSMKRYLQSSADAAALAGAQDLPDGPAALSIAHQYSASAGGVNRRPSLPAVTTDAVVLASGTKIRVKQTAVSPAFFARLLGSDGFTVEASAVASRTSTTSGTPLAIYVHEVCGAPTGNKGLISGGLNMRVEGAIHSNGNWELKDKRFESVGPATIYRPPTQGTSPNDPGHPQGPACITSDVDSPEADASKYCTGCSTGTVTTPAHAAWRDWATPYHTAADVTGEVPCTQSFTADYVFTATSPDGVYCLPNDKKFTLEPAACSSRTCQITVVAGFIEVSGTGKIEPYNSDVPVLLYSTNRSSKEIVLNPSQAYDWLGYIINRWGGIKVNAASVTSPLRGLLEAEWIEINGENFTMLGTHPDSTDGQIGTDVSLEE
jgi:Flp pilus assembly protein TadG